MLEIYHSGVEPSICVRELVLVFLATDAFKKKKKIFFFLETVIDYVSFACLSSFCPFYFSGFAPTD